MITNQAPRPWYPRMPVKLNCNSGDIASGMPTTWGGAPIANGSSLRVMDQDIEYIFDEENLRWHVWTQDGGSGGGGDKPSGDVATNDGVDEALDGLFPTAGGIPGEDEPPSGNVASDDSVNEAFDGVFP